MVEGRPCGYNVWKMQSPAELNAALRQLPKVDEVLASAALQPLLARAPRWAVKKAIGHEIAQKRARLLAGVEERTDLDAVVLERGVNALLCPSLGPLLNATGVVLHTNLGRAPLAASALLRVQEVARGYSNLEYRLDERRRGSRQEHVEALLCHLTSAEAALVVNNCAAAVLLCLAAHAAGREVIVSRGELVEIGGSFRVPDVMRASGARLVEVGTTNRTRAHDYEDAFSGATALLLKVHRSNFALVGFTEEVAPGELAELARAQGLISMFDLGSGALVPLEELGLCHAEPTVPAVVRAGLDLVTFSGDKLLGGPQAGVIVGTRAGLAPLRTHPLFRAVRPDKMALAALEATLELYRDDRHQEIPAVRMLKQTEQTLAERARRLIELATNQEMQPVQPAKFAKLAKLECVRVRSAVGGGALPLCEPYSWAVAVTHPRASAGEIEARLRKGEPPLIGRIAEDRLLLDVRTLGDDELESTARIIRRVMTEELTIG
jgi:L-seryl-tRNA(Ser) seleniumtransferase